MTIALINSITYLHSTLTKAVLHKCQSLDCQLYSFPTFAIINCYRLNGLKEEEFILLHFCLKTVNSFLCLGSFLLFTAISECFPKIFRQEKRRISGFCRNIRPFRRMSSRRTSALKTEKSTFTTAAPIAAHG